MYVEIWLGGGLKNFCGLLVFWKRLFCGGNGKGWDFGVLRVGMLMLRILRRMMKNF